MDHLPDTSSQRPATEDHDAASFFADGWKAYVPPPLQSARGLLKYYLAVLPVALPAGIFLAIGGDYVIYGAYLTIGLFVVVSVAYMTWLIRTMADNEQASTSTSPGARGDRPGKRSRGTSDADEMGCRGVRS